MYTKIEEKINKIISILDKHKAENIKIFNDLNPDYITSNVIICNSSGAKHNEALSKYIKDEVSLKKDIIMIENGDNWTVIDLGYIFIHIMTESAREFYNLEEIFNEHKLS